MCYTSWFELHRRQDLQIKYCGTLVQRRNILIAAFLDHQFTFLDQFVKKENHGDVVEDVKTVTADSTDLESDPILNYQKGRNTHLYHTYFPTYNLKRSTYQENTCYNCMLGRIMA